MSEMSVLLQRLFAILLRVCALVAGAVFALSLFVAGLIAMAGIVGWSLLRGRKPVFLRWGRFSAGGFSSAHRRAAPANDDVIDVVAREVPGPKQRLMQD
ncbi:hypothetical protein C1702_00580 [Caldimonas thermodepolymerans]|jgi:hypothetical protein|uniref:Uncharacterized protein n=2 Tax=Caldimonas thermodepolymerans TaxID=215580 RepID=A0A2S5T944_9BURK|nr:hypothetical protein C1702_00580 [Caldimonas thermodepolymerans]RDI02849.1 hypothetical protein DES46_102276 [Caldimonas thermodepolymerans]TCP08621.1 hypothetical protein EV676_102129 [Caldimonas thermodepolymerans]